MQKIPSGLYRITKGANGKKLLATFHCRDCDRGQRDQELLMSSVDGYIAFMALCQICYRATIIPVAMIGESQCEPKSLPATT